MRRARGRNRGGGLLPALNLDFIDAPTSAASAVTFTRASSGTYFDRDGVLQTATVNVPRFDCDPVTGVARGLLAEEQRTNLLLNSATLATQSVAVAAQAYTLSFYGTGSVTLSGAATGTLSSAGAYPARAAMTFTPTAGTLTLTVSGSVQYAQLEAGSFATSYIPTSAAAATRAADVASLLLSSIPGWNPAEGTVVVEADAQGAGSVAWLGDGTYNNRFHFGPGSGGTYSGFCVVGGAVTVSIGGGSWPVGATRTTAMAFRLDDWALAGGGALIGTDTLSPVPAVTTLHIGSSFAGNGHANGHIRRLPLYPRRLSNAQLQALTA